MARQHRRTLLIGLALLLAAPGASLAQAQGKTWRIGFLGLRPIVFENSDFYYGPLRVGLRELGYVEGKNLLIEWRSAEGRVERLPQLAAELVRMKPDLIVAAGTQATAAAQAATRTIPIVMGSTGDPVGSGFVKSLAHPGGNITGLSNLSSDTGPKQLQIMASIVRKLSVAAVLANPTNSSHAVILQAIQDAGRATGIKVIGVEARNAEEIEEAFSLIARQKAAALIVATDAVFNQNGPRIAELGIKHRIAVMSTPQENVAQGGLISYGQNIGENYRRAAGYIDRIFKGANPAELPVEQSTKFDLVINRKTAKALGLTIPADLLARADRVID